MIEIITIRSDAEAVLIFLIRKYYEIPFVLKFFKMFFQTLPHDSTPCKNKSPFYLVVFRLKSKRTHIY
jgi:hypothetical protein